MKKIVLFVCLMKLGCLFAQDTLVITTADTAYAKPIGVNHVYYFQLKDSLPDGVYLVYPHAKSKFNKRCYLPEIIASYSNGVRNGSYTHVHYQLLKGECKFKFVVQTNYSNGQKHGPDLNYVILPDDDIIMLSQGEYSNGKKHGVFIEYDNGFPYSTSYFEDGMLKHSTYMTRIDSKPN